MPFPFSLPTTSSVLLSDFFSSKTYPSLPLTATTKRSVLKDALKKHKRLSPRERAVHLSTVQDALHSYIPYLFALNTASGYRDIGNEVVDVEIVRPLEVEWRATLTASLPGREAPRPKLTGLHHELAFVLSTLGYVRSLIARAHLRGLYEANDFSPEQRTSTIGAAMKQLLEAHSIYTYLLSLPSVSASKDAPVDIQPSTISGVAYLAMAEATLIVVSKDDPYAAAVADDRNAFNQDWMFKAPSIPKVRAHLFARICLAAADHAGQAHGLLSRATSGRIDEDLVKYVGDFQRTARAKAIRFLAINSDLSGSTGEAIAWLNGAKRELGITTEIEDGKRKGFRGLKQSWQERREDRRVEKGGEWGMDAGRLEEARVLEMLEAKWDKENSTINVQAVPPFEPLLRSAPSGREYHSPEAWSPQAIDADELARMRAPPGPQERAFRGEEDDSEGEHEDGRLEVPVGAFPGTADDYGRSQSSTSRYTKIYY